MMELSISRRGMQSRVTLDPRGMTIGRAENCDIVLDEGRVSRLHARIFQDPFGRWIIEDMYSYNGIFVDNEKVKTRSVTPGQKITIGTFILTLTDEEHENAPCQSPSSSITFMNGDSQENLVAFENEEIPLLPPDLMKHLTEFTDRLLELNRPQELYAEACKRLSEMLGTLVAIVRLPGGDEPIPNIPDILACRFGGDEMDTSITLSKRVLESVRSDGKTVMAGIWPSGGDGTGVAIIDNQKPHLVYGARVNDMEEKVDVLYLDILELKSPKTLLHFVETAARQIDFMQKTLFYIELQEKEKALREVNEQLKEKDRIMNEYVARVTHDIKGHLAAIQSCLFVASSPKSGPLTGKQADFLNRATTRNEKLTAFVKELLNLTHMRLSGKVESTEFSLSESIAGALNAVGRKAEDKSITLTSKVDPAVENMMGNKFSINEMITNLLFNAIKYTPEGNTVSLEAARVDEKVKIDFIDTGIGIPESEVDHVFDEFFRATNAIDNIKEGTGLGLSIVKQIVDRHGGNISVISKEGEGSIFTVLLPVSPERN